MIRTHVRLGLLVLSLVATMCLGTAQLATGDPAGGGSSGSSRFHAVPKQSVDTANVKGLGSRRVTVMVEAAGDPITVAQAKADRPLSNGEKSTIRSTLRSQQTAIADHVRALGGKVGNSYQAAYNGLKVTIASRDVASLESVPGVVGVHALTPKTFSNVRGVPLIGAPEVWDGIAGVGAFAGEGIKIADIDTGLDYTHADFGGPGTVAAYQAALATDAAAPDPALVGPSAPRVKGGTDLVGDDYNADPNDPAYQPVPHPDSNPLDCNGHGTHTAGTAAGSGVLADGSTYTGPYSSSTISSHSWNVGPGVAPKADIYAVRVFGCEGSTDVVVDAIEWAVDHDMDVINMSLGSPYGGADDPDAVASNNAAKAGVIVVASAGNDGPNPYMTGTPGTASGVLSVAANDPTPSFPGATVALSTGTNLEAIDANGVPVSGLSAPVKVLYNGPTHDAAHISLGCDPAEYTAAGVAGDIVVVQRGTCARVARAIFGQQAGAAAVIMVNNVDSLPPYEGPITSNPDDGTPYDVTIPFLGVKSSAATALVAADGGTATLTDKALTNASYLATASFSSGGPRSGDSALKPEVTAPGVSIASAGMGTGNQFAVLSGTSMAAPHTTGAAALVKQAHPGWGQVAYWKAALVNTADPAGVSNYATRMDGAGLVKVPNAVKTQVVATASDLGATLSYGFADLSKDLNASRQVKLRNFGNAPVTFTVGHARDSGSPHTVAFTASRITVPAHGSSTFSVNLRVPVRQVGDSSSFHDVGGLVTLTPVGGANAGVSLSVPYYLVPRADSNIHVSLNKFELTKQGSTTAKVTNQNGAITGNADWYSWGVTDPREAALGANDIRAVGAQSFPGDRVLAFAISTYNRWSNAAAEEFDIDLDLNGDGDADYAVVEADYGLVTAGAVDGRPAVFVFDLRTGSGSVEFLADAPTDSTTMVLPVLFDQLCNAGSPCLSASNPRFSYVAAGFGADGSVDEPQSSGVFNAFTPAVSTGMFDTVAPNKTVGQQVTIDPAEFATAPGRGLMVVSHDNRSETEAQLIAY